MFIQVKDVYGDAITVNTDYVVKIYEIPDSDYATIIFENLNNINIYKRDLTGLKLTLGVRAC